MNENTMLIQLAELITENRYQRLEALKKTMPHTMVSFCTPDIPFLKDLPLKIIINTANLRPDFLGQKWEVKTNRNVHAKFAIGQDHVILGSWNFTENSTERMHELNILLHSSTDDVLKTDLEHYFLDLWNRSKPFTQEQTKPQYLTEKQNINPK